MSFEIAGISTCPRFAKVEQIARHLSENLPFFSFKTYVLPTDEWDEFITRIQHTMGFVHSDSPTIWEEGRLIGGLADWEKMIKERYEYEDPTDPDALVQVAEENHETLMEDRHAAHLQARAATLEQQIQEEAQRWSAVRNAAIRLVGHSRAVRDPLCRCLAPCTAAASLMQSLVALLHAYWVPPPEETPAEEKPAPKKKRGGGGDDEEDEEEEEEDEGGEEEDEQEKPDPEALLRPHRVKITQHVEKIAALLASVPHTSLASLFACAPFPPPTPTPAPTHTREFAPASAPTPAPATPQAAPTEGPAGETETREATTEEEEEGESDGGWVSLPRLREAMPEPEAVRCEPLAAFAAEMAPLLTTYLDGLSGPPAFPAAADVSAYAFVPEPKMPRPPTPPPPPPEEDEKRKRRGRRRRTPPPEEDDEDAEPAEPPQPIGPETQVLELSREERTARYDEIAEHIRTTLAEPLQAMRAWLEQCLVLIRRVSRVLWCAPAEGAPKPKLGTPEHDMARLLTLRRELSSLAWLGPDALTEMEPRLAAWQGDAHWGVDTAALPQ